ncbi:DMT family transporter [Nanoarchaeota archaeon]
MKVDAYLEVFLAGLIWGLTGIFIKLIDLPPATLSAFRLAVPTIVLIVFFAIRRIQPFHHNYKAMLGASFLNSIRVFLYIYGFLLTAIGNAVIVLYTWPIFATIFSVAFLKEKVTKKTLFFMALAFIGLVLVYINKGFSFADKDFIGMTLVILSGLIYAITFIIYKKESDNYSKTEIIFFQNFIGSIVYLPFFFIATPTLYQLNMSIAFGLIIGLVAFGLFFSALKKIQAHKAAIMTYVEVPSAIILGIIIFHEVLTLNMVIGGILILASAIGLRQAAKNN